MSGEPHEGSNVLLTFRVRVLGTIGIGSFVSFRAGLDAVD
jgi:hypothetical protein